MVKYFIYVSFEHNHLAESVGTVVCIALMALVASVFSFGPVGTLPAVAAALAALVLMPCFYIALNTLLPRYRSVEEVFRRK